MKKKLTIEKFTISKLNNPTSIFGGDGVTNGNTQGDTITVDTKNTTQTQTATATTDVTTGTTP